MSELHEVINRLPSGATWDPEWSLADDVDLIDAITFTGQKTLDVPGMSSSLQNSSEEAKLFLEDLFTYCESSSRANTSLRSQEDLIRRIQVLHEVFKDQGVPQLHRTVWLRLSRS